MEQASKGRNRVVHYTVSFARINVRQTCANKQSLSRSTFAKATRDLTETGQAIQLIRMVMSLFTHSSLGRSSSSVAKGRVPSSLELVGMNKDSGRAISEALIRVLVSVAENPDDPLQVICLETLAELSA